MTTTSTGADSPDAAAPDVAALLAQGRLADALSDLTVRVRAQPGDTAARFVMAELLCLAGAWDRAEAQLAVLDGQTVDRPLAIARLRHLLRAAAARQAWFDDCAVPTLVSPRPEAEEPGDIGALQQAALRLAVAMHASDDAEAGRWLAAAEAARGTLPGSLGGVRFDDFRDADDRCAWFLDALTQDGTYLWVDLRTVASLRFAPLVRPADLLWREARLSLHDGRAMDVAIPAQYPVPTGGDPVEEAHRLAQRTDWRDGPGGTVLGTGQRLFLVGEEARPILELTELRFDPRSATP